MYNDINHQHMNVENDGGFQPNTVYSDPVDDQLYEADVRYDETYNEDMIVPNIYDEQDGQVVYEHSYSPMTYPELNEEGATPSYIPMATPPELNGEEAMQSYGPITTPYMSEEDMRVVRPRFGPRARPRPNTYGPGRPVGYGRPYGYGGGGYGFGGPFLGGVVGGLLGSALLTPYGYGYGYGGYPYYGYGNPYYGNPYYGNPYY